jgi:predicted ATPase with chaperone activity
MHGATLIASNVESALPHNVDLNLIAFPQLQRLDDRGRKANCKAVAPFRNLHQVAPLP